MSKKENNQDFSPFAGFFIIGAIILVVLFLISISTWSFQKLNQKIISLTTTEALIFPHLSQNSFEKIKKKLSNFERASKNSHQKLLLNMQEINALLSNAKHLHHLQKIFRIQKIENDSIILKISLPLRSGFLQKKERWLNGKAKVEIKITEQGDPILHFLSIENEKGEIAPDFLKQSLSPYHLFYNEKSLFPFSQYLPYLKKIELKKGGIILSFATIEEKEEKEIQISSSLSYWRQQIIFLLFLPFLFFLFRKKMFK